MMMEFTYTREELQLIGEALIDLQERPIILISGEDPINVFEGPGHQAMCQSLAPLLHHRLGLRHLKGGEKSTIRLQAYEMQLIYLALRFYTIHSASELRNARNIIGGIEPTFLKQPAVGIARI